MSKMHFAHLEYFITDIIIAPISIILLVISIVFDNKEMFIAAMVGCICSFIGFSCLRFVQFKNDKICIYQLLLGIPLREEYDLKEVKYVIIYTELTNIIKVHINKDKIFNNVKTDLKTRNKIKDKVFNFSLNESLLRTVIEYLPDKIEKLKYVRTFHNPRINELLYPFISDKFK